MTSTEFIIAAGSGIVIGVAGTLGYQRYVAPRLKSRGEKKTVEKAEPVIKRKSKQSPNPVSKPAPKPA